MNKYKIEVNYRGAVRFTLNEELHRDGCLPALVCIDGSMEWYVNGVLHREDGPAIEYSNGYKRWYLHGELFVREGHWFRVRLNRWKSLRKRYFGIIREWICWPVYRFYIGR